MDSLRLSVEGVFLEIIVLAWEHELPESENKIKLINCAKILIYFRN